MKIMIETWWLLSHTLKIQKKVYIWSNFKQQPLARISPEKFCFHKFLFSQISASTNFWIQKFLNSKISKAFFLEGVHQNYVNCDAYMNQLVQEVAVVEFVVVDAGGAIGQSFVGCSKSRSCCWNSGFYFCQDFVVDESFRKLCYWYVVDRRSADLEKMVAELLRLKV